MIDFKTFESCIDALRKDNEYFDRCNDVGFLIWENIYSNGMLCSLLGNVMNDGDDIIGWWCYEKEFGTNPDYNCFDKDDNVVPLNTVRELYDFLVGDMDSSGGEEPKILKEKISRQENCYEYTYLCPSCDNELYVCDDNGMKVGKKYKHCPECGTKIRWKDE